MENTNTTNVTIINLGSDEKYDYFKSYFRDYPVKIMRDKSTGEILFDANDVSRILFENSFEEFIGSDTGLDMINEIKQKHPEIELFGEKSLFRKIN